jgi:hypothetical protein
VTVQGSKLLADPEGIVLELLRAAKVPIEVKEQIAFG